MIFQDPMTALNPVHTIGRQLCEVYELHRPEYTKSQRKQAAIDMLHRVGSRRHDSDLVFTPMSYLAGCASES